MTPETERLVVEELLRSLLLERQKVYDLTRRLDEMRTRTIGRQSGEVRRLRAALAGVSWATTLEEAQTEASDALAFREREDNG